MSWFSQGYFPEYNYDKERFDPPTWNVNCSGEEDEEIEKYDLRSVNLNGWENKTKIFYGLEDGLFFKGYIETNDLDNVKTILKSFDNFLVYKYKYGGKKSFKVNVLKYHIVDNITVFYEKREYSEDEKTEFLKDLEGYILPVNLSIETKSKIINEIKTTANNG